MAPSTAAGWDQPLDLEAVAALDTAKLFSLDGKVAVVTGAAGGIGRVLAAGLGRAGAALALVDRDESGVASVAGALRGGRIAVETVPCDLVEAEVPERVVGQVVARFGRLDVLVNCAAINRREPIAAVAPATFDLIVGVDLRAPYFLARAAAPVMAAGGGGSIINVGSINCAVGLEEISVYGLAKAGLAQATKVMAIEWARHGIRANCLAPGFMATRLSRPVWEDPVRAHWLRSRIPLRRPGRPDELVGLCLLLASDAGSYITGQTIYVDGGFLAGSPWMEEG
jgi:NAD(P)-dependent dehydrogenase (short-subunit alcohol dehydrogenase family)